MGSFLKNLKLPSASSISTLLKVAVGGTAATYGAVNSLFNVEGGHRAIVFNRFTGIKDEVYEEGTHFVFPWVEHPIIYDVRARPNVVRDTSGSRDLQMINIGLRVLTRPDTKALPEIYRTLGHDWSERVLPSIIQETLKTVVAQYNAAQLLTERENVANDIKYLLKKRALQFNIFFDDVSITQLTFGNLYMAAIEAKQVAQQEAERAKFIVDKAEQDKKSAIIKAQGDAEAARLVGEAVAHNPAFLTLRRLEAARDISETLATSQNKVFLNSDGLLLNLGDMELSVDSKKK